jgi:hypothetical protein
MALPLSSPARSHWFLLGLHRTIHAVSPEGLHSRCTESTKWTRPSHVSRWRDLNAHLSVPGRVLCQVELHLEGALRAASGRARGPSWTSSSTLDSVHYGSGGRIRTFVQRFKAACPTGLDDSGSPSVGVRVARRHFSPSSESSLRTELNCLGQAYDARLPPKDRSGCGGDSHTRPLGYEPSRAATGNRTRISRLATSRSTLNYCRKVERAEGAAKLDGNKSMRTRVPLRDHRLRVV